MEQFDFQILLTENYYFNRNIIHISFFIKIKKKKKKIQNLDIYSDFITANKLCAHFVKEISVTKYGSDKEPIPTFSPYEIYQYFDAMLKHLPNDALKTIEKTLLYSKKPVYYNDVEIEWRNYHGSGIVTTRMNATQIASTKKIMPRTCA